jgi:ADP-L-glycero-D-manno-heptose 6-epimerase
MIIVTGAAGFIGSNLVADLNAAGRADIVLVDTLENTGKWKNIAKRRFLDIVFPHELESLLARTPRADAVFHMGANSATTATDGDAIVLSNLRPSMQLWDWCARTGSPLIYASSAATYGDGAAGFLDDQRPEALDRLRPLNLYGWSKHAFDKWAVERAAQGVAPPSWAGLKFFNVYGPNEAHKRDMKSLVAKNTAPIAAGERIGLFRSYREGFADGEQLRDFVYVKDCTAVMLWLWRHPAATGLFNLGTGQARSFRDMMLAIGAALSRPVDIQYVDMPESIRNAYQYFTQADMRKLRAAGYEKPFHSLEEGVADYVQAHLTQDDPFR